jgi:hypothetical protein
MCHLDGLFSLRYYEIGSVLSTRGYLRFPISDHILRCAIQALLEKANVTSRFYEFIEASQGHDGPSRCRTVYGRWTFEEDNIVKHFLYVKESGTSTYSAS